MNRVRVLTTLASLGALLLFATAASASPITFTVTQLTTNSADDAHPQVSGDRVVWYGSGGTDGGPDQEIFTWTPTGGTVQLSTNSTGDYDPQVSGDRVVWYRSGGIGAGGDSEIFTWTPTGGTVQLTTNSTEAAKPQVSGDRVVWEGPDSTDEDDDYEIFTWTPTGGTVQLTANSVDDHTPQVSGDRVVWWGYRGGMYGPGDWEILTWTPTGGTVQLTANSTHDFYPQVSGDRVVWYGPGGTDGGGDYEVFTWTPTGGTVQLTTNSADDEGPQVSGDRVVWSGPVGTDGGGDQEIFAWTPTGGTVQLTTNGTEDYYPHVSGDRLVWWGPGGTDGGGDLEIFTAGPPPLISFSDVSAAHPYYLAISDLANRGIISGYRDGTFRPDDPVTRQQFAKMIVKTLGYPVSASDTSPFVDVLQSKPGSYVDPTDPNYPDKYVAVCAARGITQGKTATTFAPYDNITRQQLITMVVRAVNLSDPPADYTPPFSPGQFFPAEHYVNARKAAYAHLLDGLQSVGPSYGFQSPATRGEVSLLLYNLPHR